MSVSLVSLSRTTTFDDSVFAASWYSGALVESEAGRLVHLLSEGIAPARVRSVRVEIEIEEPK